MHPEWKVVADLDELNSWQLEAEFKTRVFVPPIAPQYPGWVLRESGITFNGSHALAIEI